ncbi:hypothetical protein [Streptomyces sp. NPDC093225]|uniref:hypothetical protein n=1 Tax=Streptomyces sp. NPDC093225 TaxID=3366034 RepID=UPI0037F47F26
MHRAPEPRLRAGEVAGRPGDLLTLHTLHWADEIRDPHQEVADLPGKAEPTPA